jgi:chitinase
MHGSWDNFTGHNSPLYSRSDEIGNLSYLNIDWSLNYWLDQGFPKEKLVLGLATYGRSFKLTDSYNTEINAEINGPGTAGRVN